MSLAASEFTVFLELARRSDTPQGNYVNRIPLYVTELSFNATKTIPNMGVPFSGAIRGESTNLAFDMGLVQKTVSVQGVLLDQEIIKGKNATSGDNKTATLTAFELAQLIHSYVDGSAFQDDQNINKLLVFYPSRVDNNFNMRTANKAGQTVTAEEMKTLDIKDVPLIPWNWKNRAFDNDFTLLSGNTTDSPSTAFDIISKNAEHIGLSGFIRSFNVTFSGAEFPSVQFQLEFEESTVISDNFFD